VKKIISFGLWGDLPVYNRGAIENVKIAQKIFTDWICRFYVGKNTDISTIHELKTYSNVEIIDMNQNGIMKSRIWRFLACSDPDVSVMLSRDTDSRLSLREFEAVTMWLNSNKKFHIIRDHPHHGAPILGGLWGCRDGFLKNMDYLLQRWDEKQLPVQKQYDQTFLRECIYPLIKNDCFINDEYYSKQNKLSTPRDKNGVYFLGEIFNADNTFFSQEHRNLIR